uniref:Pyridoxal kinase n=2 Tax=Diabrotica virgifera virgifera TaxID=50390 RepID=A0A6P7G208_DIAVI
MSGGYTVRQFLLGSVRRLNTNTSKILNKMPETAARVLSIQSHVVSGYVGNKSAVFPMQLLGIEVDFINSVQFSNHTGYKAFKGQILTENDLTDLVDGLSANDIDVYSHLLTGYIGSESFLKNIIKVVEHLKRKNPDLVYVCDPVMGDNGELYVPKELVPIYKDSVVKLADIITPNLLELQLLTDIDVKSVEDVWKAIDILHNRGVKNVIVSSVEIPKRPNFLNVYASSSKGENKEKYCLEIPKLPITFTGSGDLFAALILSWMHISNSNLKQSLENTIASLHAVLRRTLDATQGKPLTAFNTELKLLQSKRDIEEPIVNFKATRVL